MKRSDIKIARHEASATPAALGSHHYSSQGRAGVHKSQTLTNSGYLVYIPLESWGHVSSLRKAKRPQKVKL